MSNPTDKPLRVQLLESRYLGIHRGFYQGASRLLHDLNSPLTAIQNSFDLLNRALEKGSVETAAPTRELMESSVSSLRSIVEKWQDVLQQSSVPFEPVDVYAVLREVAQSIHLNAPGVVIQTTPSSILDDTDTSQLMMDAEPFALQQLFYQMFTNAVDAMKGKESPTIQVTVEDKGEEIVFVFDNNGEKVPDALRTTLWKDFVTSKSGHYGLGLGVVRYLLMKHGGSIQLVESQLDGAAFRFTVRKKLRQMMF